MSASETLETASKTNSLWFEQQALTTGRPLLPPTNEK